MASIEEEMRQSRQAAEDIANSKNKQDDKQIEKRLRAEMMARYSGGKQGPFDISTKGDYRKLWDTFTGKPVDADSLVFSGKQTPREYFNERPDEVNYTGIGKYMPFWESWKNEREKLMVTKGVSKYKNDFISALYNGETPLEEYGVTPIQKESKWFYKKKISFTLISIWRSKRVEMAI